MSFSIPELNNQKRMRKIVRRFFRSAMRQKSFSTLLALALIISGTFGGYFSLHAAVSTRRAPLVFQGRISDANYVPVADTSSRNMVFRIWNASTAGTCLWITGTGTVDCTATANADGVAVATTITRGIFTVPLGDTAVANMPALDQDFDNQASQVYYLEISVETNTNDVYETLSPRIRISAAPYAYNADELDGKSSALFAQLAGQVGGQTLIGGTAVTDFLTLQSTSGVGTTDYIRFLVGNNGGTEAMRIIDSGNIGIGDTTPDSLLDIQSSAAAHNGIIISQTNAGDFDPTIQFELTDGTPSYTIGVDDSDADRFKISASATLGTTDLLYIDATASGAIPINAYTLDTPDPTLDSSAFIDYTTLLIDPPTITLTGATQVTIPMDSVNINQPQIAAGGTIVDTAITFSIDGAPARTTGTLTDTYALMINSAPVGTVTNSYGLYVNAQTGATNNYAGIFTGGNVGIGTATPASFLSVTQPVVTTGSPTALTVAGGAHTTLTASAESTDINFNLDRELQFATGGITTQRAMRIQAPTYGFVGASTITNAATLSIGDLPKAGTNATITNRIGLWLQPSTSSSSNYYGEYNDLGGLALSTGNDSFNILANTPTVSNGAATDTNTYGLFVDGFQDASVRLVHTAGAGTDSWYGIRIWQPQQAQAAGTVISRGISIERPAPIISGTSYALTTNSDAGNSGFGTLTPDTMVDIAGTLSYTPSTTQTITGVGNTIVADAALVVIDPDGNYTLTSTPSIANGATGQILTITSDPAETNAVIIQDQSASATLTNVELAGDANRTIGANDVLVLIFNGTDWVEVSYSNN
ncbi:MAG: hypothetical protein Q8P56_00135 [Candidatus Uhrbacteria bacterium]|nr:hypothetical protein [Candidatus Uhrbacteria bacterium]